MLKRPFVLREIEKYSSVTNYLILNNYNFRNIVIQKEVIESNLRISKKLNIPLATKVFVLKRLRMVENLPCAIETTYHIFDDVKDIVEHNFSDKESLNTIIETNTKLQVCRSSEKLSLTNSTVVESDLLKIPKNSQILLIKGNQWDSSGRIIEYFEVVSVPEFYRFKGSRSA